MTKRVQLFSHEEFGQLEVLTIDGKPYFPATECARILGYTNPQKAIRDHCKGVNETFTPSAGGRQKTNIIPEGDLYRLIIRSKLPAAERFERWVFDEVLPSIREHGAYITRPTLKHMMDDSDFAESLLRELAHEYGKNDALVGKVEELMPKAQYCDDVLSSKNAVPVSIIARDYGLSAVAFNKLLHELGIQYKMGDTWVLYQKHANKGYTKSHTFYVSNSIYSIHTYWTQKGRRFIYDILAWYGIMPLPEWFSRRGYGC